MEKVIITGGAGFVGSHLARYFIRNKTKPHLIIRPQSSLWRLKDIVSNVFLHPLNIENKRELKKIINQIKPQFIFHLASFGVTNPDVFSEQMITTNIIGTLNLLESCQSLPLSGLVYTGTCFEYGNKSQKLITEKDTPQPVTLYGFTKLVGTKLVQRAVSLYKIPAIIVRPFTTFGPFENKGRFIPNSILTILKNKKPKISPSNPVRDFIYVEDIVLGIIKAAFYAQKYKGKIINLGSGQEYNLSAILDLIGKILKKRITYSLSPEPKYSVDNYHWAADISLAQKLLKWQPKFSLYEGLKRTINWFKENYTLYEFA